MDMGFGGAFCRRMCPEPRPPLHGWKVPYDGPVDDSFVIGPAGAAPPQLPQVGWWD